MHHCIFPFIPLKTINLIEDFVKTKTKTETETETEIETETETKTETDRMICFRPHLLELLQIVWTLSASLRNVSQSEQSQNLVAHSLLIGRIDVLDGCLAHS